jgi:hypothetical protein
MSESSSSQILQACLDPNDLVERLSEVHFKNTNHRSGHIHFYFRGKSDHIIIVWSKGQLKKIIAKSPHCKKGQYVRWEGSQFSDYRCEDVLEELSDEIELVTIDDGGFNKSWPSYSLFMKWLLQS